jgi:hypothetical protein
MAVPHLPAEARRLRPLPSRRWAAGFLHLLVPSFLALGCSEGGTPATPDPAGPGAPVSVGALRVEVLTVGGPLPDRFSVLVGETREPITPSGSVLLAGIPLGSVQVMLEGIPGWCTVAGENPRTVQVVLESLSATPFFVRCEGERGILPRPQGAASAATIGPDGGEVTATGPDGTRLSLEVPAGALTDAVEIRMTPATMDGLTGVVSRFLGGVTLEPSGLQFREPATFRITPPGGTERLRNLAGITFSADGAPEYQVARLDPTGESLLLDVDHFSGTVGAELTPGGWGAVMVLLGQVPHAQPQGPVLLRILTGVDRLLTGALCVRVTTQPDGAGRPHPRVPVSFRSVEGPVLGFVPVEAITDGDGVACAPVRLNGANLDPAGQWVVGTVVVLPGAGFESSLLTFMGVVHQYSPFGVEVEAPVNVTSDEPFRICARVANRFEPDTRPVQGMPVVFEAVPFRPGSSFTPAVTGADGRACATGLLRLPDDQAGQQDVTVRAGIRSLDLATLPTDGAAGNYAVITAERTFPVKLAPLVLDLEAPAEARFDEPTEICVVLTRGGRPEEDDRDMFLRLISGPGRFPETSGNQRLVGTTTGTSGPGRGCVTLLPGDPERDENLVVEASTFLREGDDLLVRATIRIRDTRPVLTLTAIPPVLSEAGAQSRICASLRDEGELRQVPGATVRFVVEGPGLMDPPEGDALITDQDGLACADYSAPDPLPDGRTTVTIRGTATAEEFEDPIEGSVELTLEEPTRLFSLTATPGAILTEGGESQVCAFLRNAADGTPEVGATVRFSHEGPGSVAGALLNIPTNGEGLSCTTYTAPTPLPEGETMVTIRAVATPSTVTDPLEASTTVRLGGEPEEEEQEAEWEMTWIGDFSEVNSQGGTVRQVSNIRFLFNVIPGTFLTEPVLLQGTLFVEGSSISGPSPCRFTITFSLNEARAEPGSSFASVSVAGDSQRVTVCDDGSTVTGTSQLLILGPRCGFVPRVEEDFYRCSIQTGTPFPGITGSKEVIVRRR